MKVLISLAFVLATASAANAFICNAGNVGRMFPAESPTQYLICQWAGHAPTLMNCAPGTYFVESSQSCYASDDINNGSEIIEEDDAPKVNTPCPPCPGDKVESEEKELCPDNGFVCTSYGGRMYTYVNSNKWYWICPTVGQCSYLMQCAEGTIFYEARQSCDWP